MGWKRYFSKNQRKILIIIGTFIVVYLGMRFLLPLIVPFLFAYFIAWIVRPVVGFLNKKLHLPMVLSGSICVASLLAGILLGLFYLGKLLVHEVILLLRNLPVYEQKISIMLQEACCELENFFGISQRSISGFLKEQSGSIVLYLQNNVVPDLTKRTISIVVSVLGVFAVLLIIIIAAVLIIKDMQEYKHGLQKSSFYPMVHKITGELSKTGVAYMKTQLILMSIISCIISVGFLILKNPYAILIGIFVGIFDAFPVLGSGFILIPWTIVMLFEKKILAAAIIMTVYVLCQIVREVLEPRLLGNKTGIRPIYNMMAMYIGVQVYGVFGFLLGPLSLVIIKAIIQSFEEDFHSNGNISNT